MRILLRVACTCLILGSVLRAQTNLWEPTNGPCGGDIRALAVMASNVIAGSSDQGIFVSTNNGTNWSNVMAGPSGIRDFVVKGSKLFAANGKRTDWSTVTIRPIRFFRVLYHLGKRQSLLAHLPLP